MSTIPIITPGMGTLLIPPEDPAILTGAATATLTPGMATSDGETPLQQIENIFNPSHKGSSGGTSQTSSSSGLFSSIASWFGVRGVILIIGLMLIAAGLFSLNAVKEKIIVAGKAAGKAAAVAAA